MNSPSGIFSHWWVGYFELLDVQDPTSASPYTRPRDAHTSSALATGWQLASRIARYLKATKDINMHMKIDAKKYTITVTSRSDSKFEADKADRKSVTGGVLTLSGTIVQWICTKQTGVSLSNMEAEFTSASHVGRELLVLRELINEIELWIADPMNMLMDNQASNRQLESEGCIASAKHVDIRMKFICDYTRKRIVKPEFVGSHVMKASLLTTALPTPRVAELRGLFNLE